VTAGDISSIHHAERYHTPRKRMTVIDADREAVQQSLKDPKRLLTLECAHLVDTPAEAAFDRITRLAADALDAPVCLISLVTPSRQFFKSAHGLPAPYDQARETPLSHSFCQYVTHSERPLVVRDAREDSVLCNNGAVKDLNIIAYLGVPLTTRDSQTIGSFCVIDSKPREWTNEDIRTLVDYAALVMEKVELRLIATRLQLDYLELRSLEMHRDETASMLVHDIRSPLTALLASLEQLSMMDDIPKSSREWVYSASDSAQFILFLVNQILETRKLEQSEIHLVKERISIAHLIDSVQKELQPLAKKFGITFSVLAEGDLNFECDYSLLRRVIMNLSSNALQHTPKGGNVSLEARYGDDELLIRVVDSGCGIPQDAFEKIFEKYESNVSKKLQGESTGLGLPFSRKVIEAHGGRLQVESHLGEGTIFSIHLPTL
jgi:signal transduction histidine kinase